MSSDPISPDDRPDVVAEAERLLEVPHGLVETAALARLVPALLADLKAQRERVGKMEAALKECRQEIAEQIEADVDFCCPHMPDGTPIEEEMDECSRPMIEASRALLAKVDAALRR